MDTPDRRASSRMVTLSVRMFRKRFWNRAADPKTDPGGAVKGQPFVVRTRTVHRSPGPGRGLSPGMSRLVLACALLLALVVPSAAPAKYDVHVGVGDQNVQLFDP